MVLSETDRTDRRALAAVVGLAATAGAAGFALWRANAPVLRSRSW